MIKKSFPRALKETESNPFASSLFYNILEDSKSVGLNTGWSPIHFQNDSALLPGYIKDHSYGEYIFDWGWANFYEQLQIPYYPKLVHMVPFSPVNSPKFLNATDSDRYALSKESFDFYQNSNLNSEHYLFTDKSDEKILSEFGFSHLKSLQYHFNNHYCSFDEFLSNLKPGRRKMIRKERAKIQNSSLKLDTFSGNKITDSLLNTFYNFYLFTIQKKQSYPYLTKKFFELLGRLKKENLVIKTAMKEDTIIAMSLFFKSKNVLYGRYWGVLPEFENSYPGLHFELCYYQGIDFCIEQGIELFEAGAQGEHKLWRGFEPVQINSLHHLKDIELFKVIKSDILKQNLINDQNIDKLRTYLPYR